MIPFLIYFQSGVTFPSVALDENPDLTATVDEVITTGMEAFFPSFSKTYSLSNPWYDHDCPFALLSRERMHL